MSENKVIVFPDGSAFSTASMPLPKDHWIYGDPSCEDDHGSEKPPMPFRMGTDNPQRKEMEEMLRQAGRYAIRSATMKGKEPDFDPDALIQQLVVGFLGYFTSDGLYGSDSYTTFTKESKP